MSEERKVGSIGVHMRRHVTSHGVSLNVTDAIKPWFERIVACGLADKQATSLRAEGCDGSAELDNVDEIFVEELAKALPGSLINSTIFHAEFVSGYHPDLKSGWPVNGMIG